MKFSLFDIEEIRTSIKAFQSGFPAINDEIAMRREALSDRMVENIVEAYVFLNGLLEKEVDLFTPGGLHSLLEMNHIVLCGADTKERMNYYRHIDETRKRFTKRIKPIRAWVEKNRTKSDPYKLATGFYSLNLSQPQLYFEGNHRTGNILLNYLLISRGAAPYIITPATAREYLDISGDIKFTDKDNAISSALSFPAYRKRFVSLLREQTDSRYLAGGEEE